MKKFLVLVLAVFLAAAQAAPIAAAEGCESSEDSESSSEWKAAGDSSEIFIGPTDIYGENRDSIDNPFYRYIDAEEAADGPRPIYSSIIDGAVSSEMYLDIEESGYYITADPSGNYVYITDKNGNKLLEDKFKCVYNMISDRKLPARYYGTSDLSGFALLNSDLEVSVLPSNCNYFTRKTGYNSYYSTDYIGVKRDLDGVIQYYDYNSNYESYVWTSEAAGIKIMNDKYYRTCDSFAMTSVTNANEAGLIQNNLACKELKEAAGRYDFVSLAVQAVLLKENTDIYTYIRNNKITVDYSEYLDIASPDIIVAEALNLIRPADGKYFNPDKPITRQEAAYTLNRLCEIWGISVTPYSETFEDDGEIEEWAKEAVYNVSGTPAEDTYVMAPSLSDSKFYPDDEFKLENAAACVWRIYDYENTGSVKTDIRQNRKVISPELYAFQNTDGKWGVCEKEGEMAVIVEAIYEFAADLNLYSYTEYYSYYMPIFEAYVYNGVFILSDKPNERTDARDNTYYVFNTEGELLKTFHYGSEEMKADIPEEYADRTFYVEYASGSNLVFKTYSMDHTNEKSYYPCYIKRLFSEIAVTGYYNIDPSRLYDGGFIAIDTKTLTYCLLNPDGSFSGYYDGDARLR